VFDYVRRNAETLRKSYIQYSFGISIYNVITPEDAEKFLNNPKFLTKGIGYKFLRPFLRLGLLTSTGK